MAPSGGDEPEGWQRQILLRERLSRRQATLTSALARSVRQECLYLLPSEPLQGYDHSGRPCEQKWHLPNSVVPK